MVRFVSSRTAMQLRRIISRSKSGRGNRPEAYRSGIRTGYQARSRRLGSEFTAILTGYTPIPDKTNRWYYIFQEAIFIAANQQFEVLSGGRQGTAVNSIENGNDGLAVESGGVDTDGTDYPNNFGLVPIRGATATSWSADIGPVVFIRELIDDQDNTVFVFQAMNQHDGTCDPVPA